MDTIVFAKFTLQTIAFSFFLFFFFQATDRDEISLVESNFILLSCLIKLVKINLSLLHSSKYLIKPKSSENSLKKCT